MTCINDIQQEMIYNSRKWANVVGIEWLIRRSVVSLKITDLIYHIHRIQCSLEWVGRLYLIPHFCFGCIIYIKSDLVNWIIGWNMYTFSWTSDYVGDLSSVGRQASIQTRDGVIRWKHFPRFRRESTGHPWIPSQRPVTRIFDILFDLPAWTNAWVTNRGAGDLRGHRAHYDVIVMEHWIVTQRKLCYRDCVNFLIFKINNESLSLRQSLRELNRNYDMDN